MDRQSSMGSSIVSGGEEDTTEFHHRSAPAISSSFTAKLSEQEQKMADRYDSNNNNNNVSMLSASERESAHDPEPARFGLVRESGSLSPQRSPKPKMSAANRFGGGTMNAIGGACAAGGALPLNDDSEDTNAMRPKSLVSLDDDGHHSDDEHEEDAVIKAAAESRKKQPQPQHVAAQPEEILTPRTREKKERDALLGSLSNAKLQPLQPYSSQYSASEEGAALTTNDGKKFTERNDSRYSSGELDGGKPRNADRKTADDDFEASPPRRADSMTEEQTQPPQRAIFPHHSGLPLYGGSSTFDASAPRRLDSMVEEDEEDLSSSHGAGVVEPMSGVVNKSPKDKKKPLAVAAAAAAAAGGELASKPEKAKSTAESRNESSGANGSAEAKRIGLLEKRCKELKRQLTNAENKVLELQQQNASIVEQDNSEHEELMRRFQEKETRLLQAAAEDHEQELAAVRADLEEKCAVGQRELIQERHAFQDDREHMQTLLAEANARAEQMERLLQQERSDRDKSSSQIEQQQVRALRMAEDKLAQTLAMLDEREETVQHLKTMIQTMESRMSEHREGAQEAEEEMDELHTENEALHNHVEQLQAECKRLNEHMQRLEADSEKLVHLKVRE